MVEVTGDDRDAALALLHRAAHVAGFLASPADDHYAAVWSRDAAVAVLGADASGDDHLLATARATLRTLATRAAPTGRVVDAFWPASGYADWGEAGATDAGAWFVVALADHVAATDDDRFARELWPTAHRVLTWLAHQDVTGWGVIDSPAAGDWMDSSLNRSGRVLHVNVLHAWAVDAAARLAGRIGVDPPLDPAAVAAAVDRVFWPTPGADLGEVVVGAPPGSRFPHPLAARAYRDLAVPGRRHYVASISYGRFVDRCDVLANVLAVCSGVAGDHAPVILAHLDAVGVATPYPSRTWPEPFLPDDPAGLLDPVADALQDARWRNPPGAYHNGGVWPYVGAFHAAALARVGRHEEARAMLGRVAAANRLGSGFHEWIHARTGRVGGPPDQTWNAGAFLWALGRIEGPGVGG